MKDGFDYRKFTREFKAICGSLENGEESKYDEHLKTTVPLMDEFFDEVFKSTLSNQGFCFPADIDSVEQLFQSIDSVVQLFQSIDSVVQLFQSIYSVCPSSRERLILSLGEALVYATLVELDAETEAG